MSSLSSSSWQGDVGPYPPFGLAMITVLNIAGYLMLLGIYNSASLVSTNNDLRKFILDIKAVLRSGSKSSKQ
jgi:hypothetical protein